eukprot:scaffold13674_cov30-Tisochrysis_lutea.AAC.1
MVEEIHLILPTSCAHKTMAPLSEALALKGSPDESDGPPPNSEHKRKQLDAADSFGTKFKSVMRPPHVEPCEHRCTMSVTEVMPANRTYPKYCASEPDLQQMSPSKATARLADKGNAESEPRMQMQKERRQKISI